MDVREAVEQCGARRQGLVTPALLRAVGINGSSLARARARGEVNLVRPGVYALGPLAEWPVFAVTHLGVAPELVQHVRAALLSLGDGATAAGRTAAALRGWGLLTEPHRVLDVVVRRGRSRVRLAGARILQRRQVDRERLHPHDGSLPLWVTSAVTTVLDCCRLLTHEEAVVACDSALRSGQVSLEQLRAAAVRLPGDRAARKVRRVLGACDPESGSVLESVLRVRMVQAGTTGFGTQVVVRDTSGRYVVRADFCFAAQRLVVETDGTRWHPDAARDRQLDNRLAAAGWRVLRFTWAQVVHDPAAVLALVEAALDAGTHDCHLGPAVLTTAA